MCQVYKTYNYDIKKNYKKKTADTVQSIKHCNKNMTL